MLGNDDLLYGDVERVHSRLTAGLRACRSIVSNYRAMIARQEYVTVRIDKKASEQKG
jgi:hypothetical protein